MQRSKKSFLFLGDANGYLRLIVNNLFYGSLDIIFMKNEKNYQNIIFFFIKFFLNELLIIIVNASVSIFFL